MPLCVYVEVESNTHTTPITSEIHILSVKRHRVQQDCKILKRQVIQVTNFE
jgi:hypothetical protein